MTYSDFRRLRLDALDCASAQQLIDEEGGSVDCSDVEQLIRDFHTIYDVRNVRAIRAMTGLSQAAFASEFGVPRRTIENWESGLNAAPQYTVDMLLFAVMSSEEEWRK